MSGDLLLWFLGGGIGLAVKYAVESEAFYILLTAAMSCAMPVIGEIIVLKIRHFRQG